MKSLKGSRHWIIFAIIFGIICSLRLVMATSDCDPYYTCSVCAVQINSSAQWSITGDKCGYGHETPSPDQIPIITENNKKCNPLKLTGYTFGSHFWIDTGVPDVGCVFRYDSREGGVFVDVGNTGCKSDVVHIECGIWAIQIYDPQRSGTVKITAKVSNDYYDCDPPSDPDPCDSSLIHTDNDFQVVAEIPVQVSSSSQNCSFCGGGNNQSKAAGTADVDNDSVNFQLNLGPAGPRQSAGTLSLYSQDYTNLLTQSSFLLGPQAQPGVIVLTNTYGVIQQVLTPQMLVNVAVLDGYQYSLQCFYTNDVGVTNMAGLYTTSAPAFTTWTIKNPDGASATNRLWITEQRDGQSRNFEYTYTNLYGRWDLLEPDGQTTVSTWNVPDSYDSTITNKFRQISYGGVIVQKIQMKYQSIGDASDPLLLQEVDGDGTTTNITTYTYYAGTNTDQTANRIQRIDYPNGNWVYYGYDSWGRMTTNFAAYGNNSPPVSGTAPDPLVDHCRQTTYFYTLDSADDGIDDAGDANNPWAIRKTIVSLPVQTGGSWVLQDVSRNYSISDSASGTSESQQCVNPGALWGDANNLATYTYTYVTTDWTSGLDGLPEAIVHPDGTETSYDYEDTTTTETDPDGSQTVTVIDGLGNPLSRTKTDTATGVILSRENYNYKDGGGEYYDPLRRGHDVTDLGGRTAKYRYDDCCGFSTVSDPDDSTNQFDYDILKRKIATTTYYGGATGIKTTNVLDAVGRVLKTQRIGTDNSIITLSQSQYDLLGRVVAQTNALGGVTTTAYGAADHPLCLTNTYSDGGTRIETYYRDGQLQSVTGTAVHAVEYVYGVEQDGSGGPYVEFTQEIKLTATSGTNEWTKTYADGIGRAYKTMYSAASTPYPTSQSFFNEYGQLWKQSDPDGMASLYVIDNNGDFHHGQAEYTINALSSTALGLADYDSLVSALSTLQGGIDHVTRTERSIVAASGGMPDLIEQDTYGWLDGETDGSGTLLSTFQNATSGLTNWSIAYGDASTSTTASTINSVGSSRTSVNMAPDNSYSVNTYSYGRLAASMRYDSSSSQIGGTSYGYDAHGRQNTITDARNGMTICGFDNADLVTTNITPNPGDGSPEVTLTTYNNMMQATSVIQSDGTTVSSAYMPTGELGLQSGSRTYPVGYSFDYAGRMKTMTNWSDFAGLSGARVTTWNYDSYRGFLTNKVYNDGHGPSYAYTAAGRLASRSWVRGITTTYRYNNTGSLTNILYSDSTPAVTNNYDRLGRLSSVVQNGMTDTLTYNLAGERLTESYSGGILNGLSITNGYDQFLRRTNLTTLATGVLNQTAYGYDAASRLETADDGNGDTATYSYLANSPLVSQIVFQQGSTTRMTTTKQYDYLNRLTGISSSSSSSSSSFNYSYNSANQRTKDTLVDGSYWIYGYDSLGQVTSGVKYFYDDTPVPGQQFGYQFDDIGNREQTKVGGDQAGSNQRLASYTFNSLNQTTARDYPGTNDVIGAALATNSVTVNGQVAWRKGEYFWSTVKTNTLPAWLGVTVGGGGVSNTGRVYIARSPEQFSYDSDGNLTNDGRWAYTWDGENRLIQMTVNTNTGPQFKLNFAYDSKGRRIQKQVVSNSISIYTNRFLYDGWNLIAILNPQSSILQSFMWGNDLSRSQQGAGGVGGVLEMSYHGTATTNCFPAFDGNGNLMALVCAVDGTGLANYEYGPFGEVIRSTGPMAKVNPLRFSTKYQDDESDLLYYGYRYYKPSIGSWSNRDLIEERGGNNLYRFINNNCIQSIDAKGLCCKCGVEHILYRVMHVDTYGVTMRIEIKFKKDKDYDPKCCIFRQYVKTTFTYTEADGTANGTTLAPTKNGNGEPMNDGNFNLDSIPYVGNDDSTAVGNMYANSLTDGADKDGTLYVASDTPEWPKINLLPSRPDSNENFKNEFLGIVKDKCNGNAEVARAEFTMSRQGTEPNYTYDPPITPAKK